MTTDHQHEDAIRVLDIRYRDDDFIVVDKPAGLLVHRTALDVHASSFALQILRDQIEQPVFPCHRLDRPTSGLLLFALHKDALRHALSAFANGEVRKTYLAVVRGWVEGSGRIDYPLRKEDNPRQAQDALTDYCCVRQSTVDVPVGRYPSARLSLVELYPKTGRTHQLRRHLAHIRHPILGDTRHGDGTQNRFLRSLCGRQKLMLRAQSLAFPAYRTNGLIEVNGSRQSLFHTMLAELKLS